MRCFVCGDEVPKMAAQKPHLVVTKDNDEIHVHGNIENKDLVHSMIDAIAAESGVNLSRSVLDRKEIVFHNRQRIGDMIMFTCAVRDFKKAYPDVRVNVISTAAHIFDHNPYIDRTLKATPENTLKIGPGELTNASNRIDWHFANAFRVSIEKALGVHIPQGDSKGDIYFTEEEYNAPRIFEKPYWIISTSGEKGWGCKMYPFERWQEFVNQNPDKNFVQIGAKEDNPPRLQGANVVDYVGQTQSKETGIRDLFKLFLNAEGSIGLVSFHMHLSGALGKPCIVIAGAREPVHFTRYPGSRYLSTDGCLPCGVNACWHCDISTCKNLIEIKGEKVPKCVDMIGPEELTRAINQYYIGGRLDPKVPSAKPKLKNIVPTPSRPAIAKAPVLVPSSPVNTYGLAFGGGSLTEKDWEFIYGVIRQHEVKTVLEFGAGLSTLLLNNIPGAEVITFETNQGWIDKIKAINPKCDIRMWDGRDILFDKKFDMAFVDGPAGDKARETSTKIAALNSDIVIIHDAGREWARKYQDTYLAGRFEGPGKGGHRCHLWVNSAKMALLATKKIDTQEAGKNPLLQPEVISQGKVSLKTGVSRQFIKIVSTARGWGGCARSVTTIIKMLLKAGHRVEFIPFRNKVSSREFQECIKNDLPGLIVTESYDTLREACDVLFVYADDYIWEFATKEISDTFSDLNAAARKVMMLNYRRGSVGEIPWTKGWDKYMFLNSNQEKELIEIMPGIKTKVLPPCTELEEFFKVRPNYNTGLRIVRHNSQGDVKFISSSYNLLRVKRDFDQVFESRPDLTMSMLPGPSFINPSDRFVKVPRTADPNQIAEFLSTGNLFWYSLPPGYMDMGPRVILEAMAAGLPILADNWGGAPDRVTKECGWLCDTKDEHFAIIKNVSFDELMKKGQAARERARAEFTPEKWIQEIIS